MSESTSSGSREEVGRAVEARIADLGTSLARLAEVANVGESTLRRLIRGDTWPNAATRSRIEIALGWNFGTLHRLALGQVTEERLAVFRPRTASRACKAGP